MKIPNLQLFLDRFISYNKERYKDNVRVMALLNRLKLEDITFSNARSDNSSGEVVRTVDMTVPKVMIAKDQSWIPADFDHPLVSQSVTTTVVPEDELEHQQMPGLYFYKDGNVTKPVIVYPLGSGSALDSIRSVIQSSCLYELTDAQITINSDETVATIDSPTIYHSLKAVLMVKDPTVIPETDYGDIV